MKMFKNVSPLRVAGFVLAIVVMIIAVDQLIFKPSHSVVETASENARVSVNEVTFVPSLVTPVDGLAVADTDSIDDVVADLLDITVDPSIADEFVAADFVIPSDSHATQSGAMPSENTSETSFAGVTASELLSAPKSASKSGAISGARVVIIIDDMGIDTKRSAAVVALPAGLTLAYLPYAKNLQSQTAAANKAGHELMVHVPMEPISRTQNAGPDVLHVGQDEESFNATLLNALNSFGGYVGINNHMGSRLTRDEAAMARVMAALKPRGLYFIDSRTIPDSVAANVAARMGVPTATRDVFLDHENTLEFVNKALAQVERKALKDGVAIAIGHPKDVTIEGLRQWLPTLKEKGITLVPASAIVQ